MSVTLTILVLAYSTNLQCPFTPGLDPTFDPFSAFATNGSAHTVLLLVVCALAKPFSVERYSICLCPAVIRTLVLLSAEPGH